MIKETCQRHKDGTVYHMYDIDINPEAAFTRLVRGELMFGTQLTKITETTVECRTLILGSIDITIWTGSQEEMSSLLEAAFLYTYLSSNKPEMDSFANRSIDKVMMVTNGKPLLVKLASGMIMGGDRTKVMLLAMLGEHDFEKTKSIKPNDLLAIVCLNRFQNIAVNDAIELAQ